MTSRPPVAKRSASHHTAAVVGGSDLLLERAIDCKAQYTGPLYPLLGAPTIGGGGC
jgi:hypothetical protein